MKKIKGILIKSGVLLVLFAAVLAIWLWSNQDSYSEFVVYEHDKLFHKFMENHEFEGTPIGEESVEVVSSNGKIKIRYSSNQFMRIECESGYNGFSPKIYGVDKNGDFVCDFALCDGLNGYYDPYSKEILDGIWLAESSADKLVFNVLLLQPFFRAYSTLDLASVMTVEDFEALYAAEPDLWGNSYKLIDPENITYEDNIRVWGEDGEGVPGMKHSMLLEPYYLQRTLGRRLSVDTFIEKGYDSDFMRRLESRFVSRNHKAPMALARFIIDISGDEPVFEMELIDNISPKNSRVADIIIENKQPEF